MVTRSAAMVHNMKSELDVCLGKAGTAVGRLVFVRNGMRMFTQFAYFQDWLGHKDAFNVSPDLALTPIYQTRKPETREDSLFFLALGDTSRMPGGGVSLPVRMPSGARRTRLLGH